MKTSRTKKFSFGSIAFFLFLAILLVFSIAGVLIKTTSLDIKAAFVKPRYTCPQILNENTGKLYSTLLLNDLCWMGEDLVQRQTRCSGLTKCPSNVPLSLFSSKEAETGCRPTLSVWRLPTDKEWQSVNTKQSLALLNLLYTGQFLKTYIQENQYAVYWSGTATATTRNCFYKNKQMQTLITASIKESENRLMSVRCVAKPVVPTPSPTPRYIPSPTQTACLSNGTKTDDASRCCSKVAKDDGIRCIKAPCYAMTCTAMASCTPRYGEPDPNIPVCTPTSTPIVPTPTWTPRSCNTLCSSSATCDSLTCMSVNGGAARCRNAACYGVETCTCSTTPAVNPCSPRPIPCIGSNCPVYSPLPSGTVFCTPTPTP